MSIPSNKYSFFSNADIDAIDANPHVNFFTPVLLEAMGLVGSPSVICDVGCGNGVFTSCLKGGGGRLVGVDGSSYALQQAQLLGFDELHQVEDFSSNSLPFDDETFKFIINKDVLEHLLNPEALVEEMVRITKTGGYLLISVPNHFPIAGRLQLLLHNKIDTFGYFPKAHRWDFPHIRFFNKTDFLLLMESKGLKPVHCLSHHFPAIPKIGRFMTKRARKYLSQKYPDSFAEAHCWLFKK